MAGYDFGYTSFRSDLNIQAPEQNWASTYTIPAGQRSHTQSSVQAPYVQASTSQYSSSAMYPSDRVPNHWDTVPSSDLYDPDSYTSQSYPAYGPHLTEWPSQHISGVSADRQLPYSDVSQAMSSRNVMQLSPQYWQRSTQAQERQSSLQPGGMPIPNSMGIDRPRASGTGSLARYLSVSSPASHHRASSTDQVVPAKKYTYQDQLRMFREALELTGPGPFVPQPMYLPHTNSDRRRYVEEVDLDEPLYFWQQEPLESGILLSDALHSRTRRLINRTDRVFEGRGPSVSIRIEWPGYRQWSRQIPTKDFRSPPGPITLEKLAKSVAKCVQKFIQERHNHHLEGGADVLWRVGETPDVIGFEDIVLVSIHHVSMGSWQPQLRLRRPLS